MKNSNCFHSKISNYRLIINYIIVFIPLIFFGFYKNGLKCLEENVSLYYLLKPFVFALLGLLFGFIADYLEHKKWGINYNTLVGLIIGMIIPINTNLIILIAVLILNLLLCYFLPNFPLNRICLFKIILIITLGMINNYNYQNVLEANLKYHYSLSDIFLGNQVAGISITNLFLILIACIVMSFNKLFKKDIAFASLISYLLPIIIWSIFAHQIMLGAKLLLSAGNVFALLFIASFNPFSPSTFKGKFIYSILVGVSSSILAILFSPLESAIIAILFFSLFRDLYDKIFEKQSKSVKI